MFYCFVYYLFTYTLEGNRNGIVRPLIIINWLIIKFALTCRHGFGLNFGGFHSYEKIKMSFYFSPILLMFATFHKERQYKANAQSFLCYIKHINLLIFFWF